MSRDQRPVCLCSQSVHPRDAVIGSGVGAVPFLKFGLNALGVVTDVWNVAGAGKRRYLDGYQTRERQGQLRCVIASL